MWKLILIIVIIILAPFFERLERQYGNDFWAVITSFSLGILFLFSTESEFQITQTPTIIEKNVSSVLSIKSGGGGSKQNSGSFVLETGLGKRKEFDIVFHRLLEQHFPDWNERIAYQKRQEEFYKSAEKKKTRITKITHQRNT